MIDSAQALSASTVLLTHFQKKEEKVLIDNELLKSVYLIVATKKMPESLKMKPIRMLTLLN